jgi:hypothetical protein
MQAAHTNDGARAAESPVGTATGVPERSARRATARRASTRRATARRHKGDVEGRLVEYLQEHPQSTIGDMAKGLDADRDTVGARVAHTMRSGEVTKTGRRYTAEP